MALPAVKNPDFLTTMQVLLVDGGLRFVGAIVILVAGWMLATYAKRGVDAALKNLPLDATLKPLLAQLLRYAILIITLVLVLEQFGVQTTSLIAVLGAAGLAIGLAMQGTLSNVAAGVMLLVLRPLRVGHYVQAGGQSGTVREIGLFTTILVTRDMLYLSVPNATIFGGIIINYTRERLRRVMFAVPVDRFNDLDAVEKVLLAACAANTRIVQEPAPSVVVAEIQEYAVILNVRGYARSADYWPAFYGLQKDVVKALAAANILIPVSRQAGAVRNEPLTAITRPEETDGPDAPELARISDRSPH